MVAHLTGSRAMSIALRPKNNSPPKTSRTARFRTPGRNLAEEDRADGGERPRGPAGQHGCEGDTVLLLGSIGWSPSLDRAKPWRSLARRITDLEQAKADE